MKFEKQAVNSDDRLSRAEGKGVEWNGGRGETMKKGERTGPITRSLSSTLVLLLLQML